MKPDGYIEISKFIDTRPMFGNWEIDTLMIFSLFIGIAIIFGKGLIPFMTFFGLGVMSAIFYEKLKKSKIKGFFLHVLYMLGIREPKTLPPSYMRYYIGA